MGRDRTGHWLAAGALLGCALFACGLWGCDLPPPARSRAPIRVVSFRPEAAIPRDGTVVLVLDGLLDPSSLPASSASLASGSRELGAGLSFDPVRRELTVDPLPRLLDPDIDYVLEVDGPVGFDGGRLDPVSLPIRVTRDLAPPPEPAPSFAEVSEVLSGCRDCHSGATAALGFDVDDLEHTAIGVPALQTQGAAFARGLGGTMRIEPGRPERSYLVYKLLGEGPILGAPMGDAASPDVPLPREAIAIVARWIAAGAHVEAP